MVKFESMDGVGINIDAINLIIFASIHNII